MTPTFGAKITALSTERVSELLNDFAYSRVSGKIALGWQRAAKKHSSFLSLRPVLREPKIVREESS
jgi:hypothetical protein